MHRIATAIVLVAGILLIGFAPVAAGETKGFPYAGGGNIWSNSDQDDGALYNPNGQLVSYWVDR